MRSRMLQMLAGTAMLLALAGCKPSAVPPRPDSGTLSTSIRFDFYIDGSASMRNFVAGRGDNPFRNLLQVAESTLHNPSVKGGWADESFAFYTFGATVRQLKGTGALSLLTNNPDSFNEKTTVIELPVTDHHDAAKSGQALVKIIVTDLYQSDHDHNTLSDALADQYLSKEHGAVGIAGIRNPFSGPVEDLPGLGRGSLPRAADTMPFYVIVAGENAADVKQTLDLLAASPSLQPSFASGQAFREWFSKDPGLAQSGTPQCNWRNSPKKTRTGVGNCLAPASDTPASLFLRSGTVRVSWPLTVDRDALGPAPRLQITALRQNEKGNISKDEVATVAAVPCDWPRSVCMDLDHSKLRKGYSWLYRFDIVADTPPDIFRPGSPLMRSWDVEDAEAARIIAAKAFSHLPGAAGVHSGRTPGLSQFLIALEGQQFHLKNANDPPVRGATYFLNVKAR